MKRSNPPTIWDAVSGPPSHGNPNSRAAAESIIGTVGSWRHRVAREIAYAPVPLAAWQIMDELQLSGDTVRPRLVELCRAGIIALSDLDGTTPSGRSCQRYAITELGIELLAATR